MQRARVWARGCPKLDCDWGTEGTAAARVQRWELLDGSALPETRWDRWVGSLQIEGWRGVPD